MGAGAGAWAGRLGLVLGRGFGVVRGRGRPNGSRSWSHAWPLSVRAGPCRAHCSAPPHASCVPRPRPPDCPNIRHDGIQGIYAKETKSVVASSACPPACNTLSTSTCPAPPRPTLPCPQGVPWAAAVAAGAGRRSRPPHLPPAPPPQGLHAHHRWVRGRTASTSQVGGCCRVPAMIRFATVGVCQAGSVECITCADLLNCRDNAVIQSVSRW